MASMRVMMIEQGGRGGLADYTAALTAALGGRGDRVTLVSATDHRYEPAAGVEVLGTFRYVRGRSRVGRVLRRRGLSRAFNGLAYLAVLGPIAVRARRHDVVHVQGEELPVLGLALMACLRAAGRPVVYTPHNTFSRGGDLGRSRDLQYRLSARIIVHARADLANLPPSARARAEVIPHGEYGTLAESGRGLPRDEARAALGLAGDEPVALLYGQLRPDKGLGDALAAVAATPAVRLLVAGRDVGGVLDAHGEALSDPRLKGRLVVQERFLSRDETATAFAAADVALLPYQQVSASGVLLLSWGFGVAPVGYPVGGLAESIEPGRTGWLTPSADPQGLATSLAEVAAGGGRESARRGALGRELMHARYGWPVIAEATAGLYASARTPASG